MYKAVTRDIQVTVMPEFRAEESQPDRNRYLWAYTIEVANLGALTVQLVSRHWHIVDANGKAEDVRGPGVVGEQPLLKPGESFRYTSGCPLSTPSGIMRGTFRMVDEHGVAFDATVPAFSLDLPQRPRSLN